jgi:hypothetical protein
MHDQTDRKTEMLMSGNRSIFSMSGDWARSLPGLVVWWVLPIVVGNVGEHLLAQAGTALVWAVALSVMGLGCALNAHRCHRRHCYYSGPIFFAGALVVALQGLGVVPLAESGLGVTLWATFGLVLLSFVPEAIWGRYAQGQKE